MPDPVVSRADGPTPEDEALLADSVGLALQVVLETLTPAERLAFVLHDLFDLPFEDIAAIVDRSPTAARQLASRGRRRVREAGVQAVDRDMTVQRKVVDAFFAAAHNRDFDALVAVLDPEVVARMDGGTAHPEATMVLRGATAVASRAVTIADPDVAKQPVLVNGTAGVLAIDGEQPIVLLGFTVSRGKIVAIDAFLDPARLEGLSLAVLSD